MLEWKMTKNAWKSFDIEECFSLDVTFDIDQLKVGETIMSWTKILHSKYASNQKFSDASDINILESRYKVAWKCITKNILMVSNTMVPSIQS